MALGLGLFGCEKDSVLPVDPGQADAGFLQPDLGEQEPTPLDVGFAPTDVIVAPGCP